MVDKLKEFRRVKGWTQQELAEELGVSRSLVAMMESGGAEIAPKVMVRLRGLGFDGGEVGDPLIPASQLLVPVTYIGYIAASDPVNWTDPFESETFEFVPPEMGDPRGRFACRISSDSMYPLLEPQDVCVFQRTDVPRIGQVILFRSDEGLVTVKQLKHDGEQYVLLPLNTRYDAFPAEGAMLGYLVGIVRERGTQRITIYDSSGIVP
ncbi:hypothetical protein C0431_00195 [bacterium]|jgi:repressor LexA|nr:hypothetical protein [bacterium]